MIAQRLYEQARHNLNDFLKDSSHIKRLRKLNIEKDIDFCLTEDKYDVLPLIRNGSIVILKP